LTVDPFDVDRAHDLLARLVADEAFHRATRAYALDALDRFGFAATRGRIERSIREDLNLRTG
jgi:hypothetical protein